MENLSVRVLEDCMGSYYEFGLCKGKKVLMVNPIKIWRYKSIAIRNAKAMAKRIGIPYDPEIIKQHGC